MDPAREAEANAELEEMLKADTLRPDDRELLRAIFDKGSVIDLLVAINSYYRDRDRADRTPRVFLYLHFGMLSGMCDRMLTARPTRPTLTTAAGMLEACAEHLEPLAVGYGAEQMRAIARALKDAGTL